MKKIIASFDIVSPMFIQGADNSDIDIRPPSIKGALRFWWRAHRYAQICLSQTDQAIAIKQLHHEEVALFGSAATGKGGTQAQSNVLLKLKTDTLSPVSADQDRQNANLCAKNGCTYLLGMGLYSFRTKLQRPYLNSGTFTLTCSFKPLCSEEQIEQVKQALLLFGLLGGLGSRARKGFGSVQIKSLSVQNAEIKLPADIEQYKSFLHDTFAQFSSLKSLPEISSFSSHSMCDLSLIGKSAELVLNEVGLKQQMFRGFGHNQDGTYMVNSKPALQRFYNDHHALYNALNNNGPKKVNFQRSVFGLPLPVRFSKGKNAKFQPEATDSKINRRASPLFIHIAKFGNEYVAIQTLLASKFLPDSTGISAGNGITMAGADVNYDVIKEYLSKPQWQGNANRVEAGFTSRHAVFPASKQVGNHPKEAHND